MRVLILVWVMMVIPLSPIHADTPDKTVLIRYNHGTSDKNNCARSLFGKYKELPRWARKISGHHITDQAGRKYDIKVEFVCTNEPPGSFGSDAEACDLGVCRRSNLIAKLIDERAHECPRRQIFLAGQSAGAWASLLIKRHAPKSVNGLILTAPAFGGRRIERTCTKPTCSEDEAPAWRRMRIRAHHEDYVAQSGGTAFNPLDAVVVAFPCDSFGWPSELPIGSEQGVTAWIFPPIEQTGHPLKCGALENKRYYNGRPRQFCKKLHNRNQNRQPVCSEKRIAYCPKELQKLCSDKSHSFFDDFLPGYPGSLQPPVFSNWFVDAGVVLDFLQERLNRWSYGDGQTASGSVCGFMDELPMCR